MFIGQSAFGAGGANAVAKLVSTQLDGGKEGGGTLNCVGAYDGAFAELDNQCNPVP